MKRLITLLLSALMLSSLCSAFAESNIFSYVPGNTLNETADEDTAALLGKFTEDGYVNDYFHVQWNSLEQNETYADRDNNEIIEYLKTNEFYPVYKEGDCSISIFRADCYGEAASECRFLELFKENALSYPWNKENNNIERTMELHDMGIGNGHSSAYSYYVPCLSVQDSPNIIAVCFISGDYVLMFTSEKNWDSLTYDFDKRIENEVRNWNNIESVCICNGFALGITKNGSVQAAGMIPHFIEFTKDWKNIRKIVSSGNDYNGIYALDADGRVLEANITNYYNGSYNNESPDYDENGKIENPELRDIIDISRETAWGSGFYSLKADGNIYVDKELLLETKEYLPEGEKLTNIYADLNGVTGSIFVLSDKGNIYEYSEDKSADPSYGVLHKLDVSGVRQVVLYDTTFWEPTDCFLYALTDKGTVAAFGLREGGDIKFDNTEYSNIADLALVYAPRPYDMDDPSFGCQLILIDSAGSVCAAEPARYSLRTDYVYSQPDVNDAANVIITWENISKIESDFQKCTIGIKKDGTAVCAPYTWLDYEY